MRYIAWRSSSRSDFKPGQRVDHHLFRAVLLHHHRLDRLVGRQIDALQRQDYTRPWRCKSSLSMPNLLAQRRYFEWTCSS